jgi:hypothetical protein
VAAQCPAQMEFPVGTGPGCAVPTTRTPRPRVRFFKHAILHQQFGHKLLELVSLRAQPLHFVAGRFACSVACQPLLARLQKVLRPAIIEVLVDASLRHSSAMLSSPRRPANHDPGFLFCRELPPSRPADVAHGLFRFFRMRIRFRSDLHSSRG